MTPAISDEQPKKHLPLADAEIESVLRHFEQTERARLGLEQRERWLENMARSSFTRAERSRVTLLVGGLTLAHDIFIEASLKHLGYSVLALDPPDGESLRVGKELGNRGQCNPTYFTVGNLVKFLCHLRDEKGMSTREIVDSHVFVTAGACGPCRFGMYVTEYRKALRDAGFEGFRVLLFQQQGGLSQSTGEDAGLTLNPAFFLALIRAILAGDVLNALAYRIRPYELEAGATDRALERAKRICYDALAEGRSILWALTRVRRVLGKVQVDRTRVRPRVAIIGEFWAMTTEGDGNYRLQRFLEREGAEVDVQPVTAWLLYNIWEVAWDTENRAALRAEDSARFGLGGLGQYGAARRQALLWAADHLLRAAFHGYAWCAGLFDYHLPDMTEVAEAARPHYANDLRGGEGHMEVGKLILNVTKQKATMTLSVKPFGCMPSSSVSDGVQTLIAERYPGAIYCAVETSGDGAVNFHSRVQMVLFKARQAAAAEAARALEVAGLDAAGLQRALGRHPQLQGALHRAPHAGACTTTDLIHEVAALEQTTRLQRAKRAAWRASRGAARSLGGVAKGLPRTLALAGRAALELGEIVRDEGTTTVRAARRRLWALAWGLRSDQKLAA